MTQALSGEARKATTAAISAGVPTRPTAWVAMIGRPAQGGQLRPGRHRLPRRWALAWRTGDGNPLLRALADAVTATGIGPASADG
ncbi:hypothetical protein ACWCQS_35960 [Streptomyces sp. NPDC002076]